MYQFSKRSLRNLQGIKPPLVDLAHQALALSKVDFGIIEGLRTRERQAKLVAAGASQTLDSRHLTGHAVDLAAYIGRSLRWDFNLYIDIAEAWRAAALALGIPIIWGAAWRRQRTRPFLDAGHFELPRSRYP